MQAERCKGLVQMRIRQLSDEDISIRLWLRILRPVGWLLLVISIVCPVAAGSIALGRVLGTGSPEVAVLSFAGAIAIALHKGLGCEAYQAAMLRTILGIRSLVESYEALAILPDDELVGGLTAIEQRLAELRSTSVDLPPARRRSLERVQASGS